MLLLHHITRASHLWLSCSFVSKTLCGLPAPWMVLDQSTQIIVDIDTFFKHQCSPMLLGTDEPAIPRHIVKVAQRHHFSLRYPTLTHDIRRMPGKPGPPSHQHRFRQLANHDYRRLCQLEDALAREILPEKPIKIITIVPSKFILPDSVPSRIGKKHTTLSVGADRSGRYVLLPETDEACSSS